MRTKREPRIEHPNDLLLRVTRTTICGSDMHLFHGLVPDTRVGSTFGHEFTGVVERVGPSVQNVREGDRVLVPFNIACGSCFFCARGLFSCCDETNPCSTMVGGVFGYSHTTGGYDGGQAEFVRVPMADVGPMKIPDDLSEEQVLLLTDVLPTGYQAAEMGDIKPDDTVVVFGCGPVGLVAQRAARLMGAGRVIGVDDTPYRIAFAERWAGSEGVDFRESEDIVKHLRRITDGRGADVVIDAVGCEAAGNGMHSVLGKLKMEAGAATSLEWAIHVARKGGTVVVIGVYGPPYNLVPLGTAMNKGLTLRMGQCNVKRYLPRLLELVTNGELDPLPLLTHRFPLSELPEAYHLFEQKKDGVIKAVLVP